MKIIHPSEVNLLRENPSVLCLDIRECFEYEAENLGWTNLPMEQVIAFLKQEEVSKDQKLLLLCNSGKRASALGNLLETEQAFLEVYIVEDGMQGWNRWIESKPR